MDEWAETSAASSRSFPRRESRARGRWAACVLLVATACSPSPREPEPGPPRDVAPTIAPWLDPTGFERLAAPAPGDWRAHFDEPRQSFDAYVASDPPGRTDARRRLSILPLGTFEPDMKALLREAARFAGAYFQVPIRIERAKALPPKHARTRTEGGRTWTQYCTTSIFKGRLFRGLPSDAIACLGVTVEDIYPNDDWNFVFGEAYLTERVGVYSLARYRPRFRGHPEDDAGRARMRLRAFKVLAHETAHMFGLEHCVDYRCCVNGSNSLRETDAQPIHLCPTCLRKLHHNLGFDPRRRYRQLLAVYERHGLDDEAAFVRDRLARARRSVSDAPAARR